MFHNALFVAEMGTAALMLVIAGNHAKNSRWNLVARNLLSACALGVLAVANRVMQ